MSARRRPARDSAPRRQPRRVPASASAPGRAGPAAVGGARLRVRVGVGGGRAEGGEGGRRRRRGDEGSGGGEERRVPGRGSRGLSEKRRMMNKLYIGNLSPAVTADDLRQLFGDRKLPLAGQVLLKSGYAFVDYPDQNWAIRAIETLSGEQSALSPSPPSPCSGQDGVRREAEPCGRRPAGAPAPARSLPRTRPSTLTAGPLLGRPAPLPP